MPFDPEATGIIPRLDLDAAKDRADTPNPADADQPTDGSADDRPSDEEAAEEPPPTPSDPPESVPPTPRRALSGLPERVPPTS
ncbi:hypothetical protein ACFSTC_08755 [Nonomuraea ferruginea]